MSFLDEILMQLGWEDGFQMPVANGENQALEEEVARLTLQKIKAKTAYETSGQKLENLQNHLKHVKQESEQNQNLITAHAQRLQSEEHILRVNEADKEKMEQEVRQFNKQINDVNVRRDIKKTQLEKCAHKLEKLKAETNWDAEALKAWEECLQKRDHDNELIKKFSKEDERKYNELEAKRMNLEVEYASRKQTIDKMVNDLINYERMLERTGKVMAQQAEERNALIRQWKDSVHILHQRDTNIDRLQSQIFELQELTEKQKEKLEEEKQFLQNEVGNNKDIERESHELNMLNSRMRRDLNDLHQHVLMLHSEADTLRRAVINSSNELEKIRGQKRELKENIAAKERMLKNQKISIYKLKEKCENLKQTTLDSDAGTKHWEKLIDYETKLQKQLQNENECLQNAQFRAQQDLQEHLNASKSKQVEIYGAATTINHLRKHNEDTRKTVGKQKEDVYQLDFKIDEVQRQILLHENEYIGYDKEYYEAKVAELESKMAEHTEVKNLLKDQVQKIRDEMRRLTTAIVSDQNQLSYLQDKLQDRLMSLDGGQKQVDSSKKAFQEKQVEENILRLRVNNLNKAMKKEEKSIYNSQRFRLNLEQATKERLLEINTNKEILSVQRRTLNEDNGRLKSDLAERRIRLEQFQKKYDIILKSLGKDDDGQPVSMTHIKVRNAQEKYILQQEGDELDRKIKKAEKEIVAMENTLKIVNLTNTAFKQSLGAVDEGGKEMEEMKALDMQLTQMNNIIREHRQELAKKKQELADLRAAVDEYQQKHKEEKSQNEELSEEFYKVERDRMMKEEKLQRTEKCLRVAEKKISKSKIEIYARDLEVRQLRDANKSVTQKLTELSVLFQEIAPLLSRYSTEYEVKLPEKPTATGEPSLKSFRSCSEKDFSVKSSDSSRSSAVSKVVLTFDM